MADRWWIAVEGQADAMGRGRYLGTILTGETIGELALLDGEPRTATGSWPPSPPADAVRVPGLRPHPNLSDTVR